MVSIYWLTFLKLTYSGLDNIIHNLKTIRQLFIKITLTSQHYCQYHMLTINTDPAKDPNTMKKLKTKLIS